MLTVYQREYHAVRTNMLRRSLDSQVKSPWAPSVGERLTRLELQELAVAEHLAACEALLREISTALGQEFDDWKARADALLGETPTAPTAGS